MWLDIVLVFSVWGSTNFMLKCEVTTDSLLSSNFGETLIYNLLTARGWGKTKVLLYCWLFLIDEPHKNNCIFRKIQFQLAKFEELLENNLPTIHHAANQNTMFKIISTIKCFPLSCPTWPLLPGNVQTIANKIPDNDSNLF